MPRIARKSFEGFLVPDPLCTPDTIDAAKSSYTQQGLYPGIPVPGSATSCALRASGDMVSSDDVRVICQIAGMPDRGAEIVHRLNAAAATTAMGWEQPNVITGIEVFQAYDSDQTQSDPCPVTLSDGTVLVFYDFIDLSPVARQVNCRKITAAGVMSTITVVREGLSTYRGHPCACVLEDDRVVIFWGEYVPQVGSYFDTYQINAAVSSDAGATWNLIAYDVLPTPFRIGSSGAYSIDPTSMRMSAAYKDGQILLLITVNTDLNNVSMKLNQYASTDGGCSFTLVDESDDTTVRGGDRHQIVVKDGLFIVGLLRNVDNTGSIAADHIYPQSVRLASAYDPLFSQTFTTITATEAGTWTADAGTDYYISDGDLSLVALNGILYCHFRKVASPYEHLVYYSKDNGDSWSWLSPTSDVEPFWWHSDEAGQHWQGWRATDQRGRLLMITGVDGDTQPEKHLWALTLGGWTNQTLPQNLQDAAPRIRSWSHWGWTWMPTGLPSGWSTSVTTTGTASVSNVTAGYHLLTTTSGNSHWFEVPLTGGGSDASVGQMIEFEVLIPGPYPLLTTSSTGGTIQAGVRLYTADLGVSIALGFDYIHVYDDNAGTLVGYFTYPGDRIAIRVYVGDSKVRTWYATVVTGSGVAPTRSWTAGPTGTLTTGTPSPTDVVQWGHIDNTSTGSMTTHWWRVQFANEDKHAFPYDIAQTGQTNPTDLSGAYLTSTGTELRDGLIVSAATGPYYVGEYHVIAREWEYALTQCLPQVEPSRTSGWRSTSTAQQDIVFDRQLASSDTTIADVWGICLWGTNFQTFKVYRYIGGVAALIDTVDIAEGMGSLPYQLDGNVVMPSSSASSVVTRWIYRNELAGGFFIEDVGLLRRIIGNDAGVFGDYDTNVPLRIYLDPDEINGSETPSGTGTIVPPRCFWFFLENQSGGKTIEELRIRIESQDTPDNYFKIDLMMIVGLKAPGAHPSWGRVSTKEPNVILTEYEDGRRSSVVKGDSRRVLRVGWTDGISNYGLLRSPPDPDWYGAHTETGLGVPMVARDDTPANLWGLLDEIGGSSQVIAWLKRLQASDAPSGTFSVTHTDPERVIPVRWVGGVELTEVQTQDEHTLQTVATITMEEEL